MSQAIPILLVLIAALYAALCLRMLANRDREWERRWRQLSASERRRIYRAARRGELLEDPDEAAIAAGSARSQRELLWHPTVSAWTMLAVFSAITLAAASQGGTVLVAIGLAGVGFSVWRLRRGGGVARNLARAEEVNRLNSKGPA
jgi:hypothetical protein